MESKECVGADPFRFMWILQPYIKWWITFIDDYSRKTWVSLLQEKSETFSAFRSFKEPVETEMGMSIKSLCSVHGQEYNSQESYILN